MYAAASYGLKALVQDGSIAWIESETGRTPPRRLYPSAFLVTVHETPTSGRKWRIGDRWPGEMA